MPSVAIERNEITLCSSGDTAAIYEWCNENNIIAWHRSMVNGPTQWWLGNATEQDLLLFILRWR